MRQALPVLLVSTLVFACSAASNSGNSSAGAAGSSGDNQETAGGNAGASGTGASSAGVGAGGSAGDAGDPAALGVTRVRAEYRENPLGIATAKPRFDWLLSSTVRGQRQTAYRILVSSTEAGLSKDQGDWWDSGKVLSDQSTQVEYAGAAVSTRTRAFWKVQVWDKDGLPSPFSKVGWWERGPDATDLSAQWITGAPAGLGRDGVSWIWFPEGDPVTSAPAGDRYFRKSFNVTGDAPLHGSVYFQADDLAELFVNGKSVGSGNDWKMGQTLDITSALTSGLNVIAAHAQNGAGSPAGFVAAVDIRLSHGLQALQTDASWKAANSADQSFANANFDDSKWSAAMATAKYGSAPWGERSWSAPRYFRREFSAAKGVTRARVYATALGIYELWLNGARVGDEHLTPGWTDYKKRVQVQTYDVTSLVVMGANAIGAILADGWFSGKVGFNGQERNFGAGPDQLRVQLELEYDDGSKETVASDAAWAFSYGPIQAADLLDGETYDARLELGDWSKAAYDDSQWQAASVVPDDATRLVVADATAPVTVQNERKPLSVKSPKTGVYIYDFGQNLVGWERLSVKGAVGSSLTMRFAEVLNPDGTLYTTNLRSAKATDRYFLRGGEAETFEPRFTTHGYRYLELSGDVAKLSSAPDLGTVTAIVAHSDTPLTNSFETSSPLVNQLQSNIVWGQTGNFVSVPTDCPQRDERLGWMGDAQIFARTATFNADVASFFSKFVRDISDGQNAAGAYADVSPRTVFISDAAPAWGDAGVIVPYTVYLAYGDTRILAEQYDSMVKWVSYVSAANPDFLWKNQRSQDYGDWLNVNAETNKELLASAFYAHSVDLVAKSANVLGKAADATKYAALFASIRKAFAAAYLKPDGTLLGNTQAAYALAMRFGLLDDAALAKAGMLLAADVDARKHLSTGFLGVAHLLPALTQAGRLDAAYQLLNNEDYPSWGYQIKLGATTIWERWDGIQPDGNFQTPAMNSFNHYSLGSVGEWLYTTVSGIDWDETQPGYKHFFVRPKPGGGLTSAHAAFDSIHGRIDSSWSIADTAFKLEVKVPVGSTASVVLPFTKNVRLDGMAATAGADGSYSLESGAYVFIADTQ